MNDGQSIGEHGLVLLHLRDAVEVVDEGRQPPHFPLYAVYFLLQAPQFLALLLDLGPPLLN